VWQITATVKSQTLVATNRKKHLLVRDGVQVTFRNHKGEWMRQRLRIFDYIEPPEFERNTKRCTFGDYPTITNSNKLVNLYDYQSNLTKGYIYILYL
jgi:hypothetical protein